MDKPLQYLG